MAKILHQNLALILRKNSLIIVVPNLSLQEFILEVLGVSDFQCQLDIIQGQEVSLKGEEHGRPVGKADGQVLAVLTRCGDDCL